MKYRPSPLNILAVVVTVKYIVLFIRAMNGMPNGMDEWASRLLLLLFEFFIPAFFLGIDYALQKVVGLRKYFHVLLIELGIIILLGLVMYYGYNIRTFYEMRHTSIFDRAT